MHLFKRKFLYNSALERYMKDFYILFDSQEAKEIRIKIEKIIDNPGAEKESECFVVALAATAVQIEKERAKKEELIERGTDWLSFPSQALAARYLFKDLRAHNLIGAKEVFKEGLEKYCS
jgi:hypothetical protein